jgi:phosphoribosyl 1,2-cyclic phosphodiesterase
LLRFASLASGSSGNCLVVEAGDRASVTRVLLDCGLNLTDTERRLARLGLQPSQIDGMLITHEHGDHAHGVFDFAAAHGVVVYLTYGTMLAMKAEGKVIEGVRMVYVNARQSEAIGGMQVIPFTVPHDARAPTPHVAKVLSGLDALVLECNYDREMLWAGSYPRWLKERIAGPFGHLDNEDSGRLLAALDCSRLRHIIGAHLSQQNNRPALARAVLARALNCDESWVGLASQDEGFGWREL